MARDGAYLRDCEPRRRANYTFNLRRRRAHHMAAAVGAKRRVGSLSVRDDTRRAVHNRHRMGCTFDGAMGIHRAHAEGVWHRSLAALTTHVARARRIVDRRLVESASFNRRDAQPRSLVMKFNQEYR